MSVEQDGKYIFRSARVEELKYVFSLINERIHWMDKMGINQWNKIDYWKSYPTSYFYIACSEKRLYILKDEELNRIVAVGVLSEKDNRWNDDKQAIYLHNFVTAIDVKNIGSTFLEYCEEYATLLCKNYMRLDCKKSNEKLNKYYEMHGYVYVEEVVDGEYVGNKREKKFR